MMLGGYIHFTNFKSTHSIASESPFNSPFNSVFNPIVLTKFNRSNECLKSRTKKLDLNSKATKSPIKMSTRSQNGKVQQVVEVIRPNLVSPGLVETVDPKEQDVLIVDSACPKYLTVERSELERMRASLKDEIKSEIQSVFLAFRKKLFKLPKPRIEDNIAENLEPVQENVTREFYTRIK